MKRFDKGYVYSSLLSDLFGSLVIAFALLNDIIFDEEAASESFISALPFLAGVFAVIYLFFIIYRILYYRASGYELTDTELICKRGVLFRKRSVLEYKRVHAINKKQSLFHRIFGIAVLTIDSGSTNTSQQAEITIIEKSETVDLLVDALNTLKDGGERAADVSKEEVLLSDEDSLYRFTSGKKMLYTLISIVSTAFFTAVLGILAIAVIGVCKLMLRLDALGTWGQYLLFSVLITLGAMLLLSIVSLIGCMIYSFVGYYKFTVTKRGNDIQISYGLLERHVNTFSYDRIKAVKITQGLVQRMLGFADIRLEVIGYTSSVSEDNSNTDLGVLVPFCKYSEVSEILRKVLPDYVPDEKQTKSASYFPFISWFLLILSIVMVITLVLAVANMMIFNAPSYVISHVSFAVVGAGIVILAIKAISAVLSYHNNGIAINNGKITSYYGDFTKNITVFMSENLVAVEDVTTPLRKKKGIASIVMHLKTNAMTNEIKVHIQKDALAGSLQEMLRL